MRTAFSRRGSRVLAGLVAVLAAAGSALAAEQVESRAAVNFRLNCAGCHLPDGTGRAGLVPALAGSLGKLIAYPGGREYIARIPGVANSFMSDAELADVLNWALYQFDRQHVPAGLVPYTAEEVGRWRKQPMSDATMRRASLAHAAPVPVAVPAASAPAAPVPPPAAFALCGACHPTSANAANGIGPNLRGVIGRTSGQVASYLYSAAMKNAGIVWGPETLDRYLTSPATAVPGNAMTYRGEQDPAARAAIIAYLQTLQ